MDEQAWFELVKSKTHKKLSTPIFLVFLILIAMTRGRLGFSLGWSNMGLLGLSQALIHDENPKLPSLFLPEMALEKSLLITKTHSAWRALGFVSMLQGEESKAISDWQNAGDMGGELIRWGHCARVGHCYGQELEWYYRASKVETGLGDAWYYMALVYYGQQRWGEALQSLTTALQAEYLLEVGISDVYLLQGAILQSAPDFQNIDQALQAIDMALQLDAFRSDALKSEAFHKRGFIYEQQGVDLQDAISEYRKALDLQPDHRWARLRLGHALYFAYGDAEQAEKEIKRAIMLGGDDLFLKWAYRYLGDLYRYENRFPEAVTAYQEAMKFGEADEELSQLLDDLLLLRRN